MTIKAGLVGMPNVGKSTLFNALTNSQVPAENYPFCTIDPHTAITKVPDPRINELAKIYGSAKLIPATMTFVDIAGLVKGASLGQGLGNQFLSHIREVDLILHVVRCFQGSGEIDPIEHLGIICEELLIKDAEMIEKRKEKIHQQIKACMNKIKEKQLFQEELELLENVEKAYNSHDINKARLLIKESSILTIPLISTKNFLIIVNVQENEFAEKTYINDKNFIELQNKFGKEKVIAICAKTESELSSISEDEQLELMELIGMKERGLDTIISKTYTELGLITFFTMGPKEAHAWPILKGTTIRKAAGEIHSDLEKGFICSDIFNYKDIIEHKSEANVKSVGKFRNEGQNYLVQDGDIINIKFNV